MDYVLLLALIVLALYTWVVLAPDRANRLIARFTHTSLPASEPPRELGAQAEPAPPPEYAQNAVTGAPRSPTGNGSARDNPPGDNGMSDEHDTPVAVFTAGEREHEPAPLSPASTRTRPRFRDRPAYWWLHLSGEQTQPISATPHDAAHNIDVSPTSTQTPASRPVRSRQPHVVRGLAAAVLAVIVLAIALTRLPGSSPAPATPTPLPLVFAPVAGPPITTTAVLGTQAGLAAPREAIMLPDGTLAVADTDHHRLAFLDRSGHYRHGTTGSGPSLREPYAVIVHGNTLYVLDSVRMAIEQYDLRGRFEREVIRDAAIQLARGMSVDSAGRLYVANPLLNSIVIISPQGQILRQIHTLNGAGPGDLNQPSDIAVNASGTLLYVLDNQNNRIEELRQDGSFIAQWPAPSSDTMHSVHLLVLDGGRLLASDPAAGALVLYTPGQTPLRRPLAVSGTTASPPQPLGLSLTPQHTLLITDSRNNRLLVTPLPS